MLKASFFFLSLLGGFIGFSYLFIQSIQSFLFIHYHVNLTLRSILHVVPITHYALLLGFLIVIWLLFICDIRAFYYRIKTLLLDSLSERKLPRDFPLFESGNSFNDISSHLYSILSLYKSFDTMKTSRIMLEVNSIKLLMNVVDEGVLLVNSDRVVTHINHNGEQLFRLIPGEIIGESISRKISNALFLEHLDQTLEFDQKIIGKKIMFGDKNVLLVSIFPIKDKFGDVVRSLVVVRKYISRSKSTKETEETEEIEDTEETTKK
jgi:hypothetical protein